MDGSKYEKKYKDLYNAVCKYIRVEFLYRLGANAYQADPSFWMTHAEEELRNAVLGVRGLAEAGEELGLDRTFLLPKFPPALMKKKLPKKKTTRRFKVRKQKR